VTIILDDNSLNKTCFPKKTKCQKFILYREFNFLEVVVMFECDNEDDVGGEDLDAKILVCYIHKKGIKLDVVLKMIFL